MLELLTKRRTQYALGRNLNLTEDAIDQLIRDGIRNSPSPFNSQSSRAIILFGDESQKFWNIVKDEVRPLVAPDMLEGSMTKISSFAAGVGTILFFEDQQTVQDLQKEWPIFAEHFPDWSEQSGGMAQYVVWTMLANKNIGASLQHYNPIVDAKVAATWDVPSSWRLRAQMPFGSNEAPFPDKEFMPDAMRFRTHR
ncbi:nitroreductase family protein [Hyphomicrobium sp.]|uniref:nitroreductase family protein n=1 Tax=Hyphomicrobium sp. TaxID=82 RepID=UPI002FE3990A